MESEDRATFIVSISNAPNDVRAFGFDIRYDLSVLNYSHYDRGELVLSGFQFLNTNNVSPGLIRIGGIETDDNIIPKGSSGAIAELYFKINKNKDAKLSIENLKDDVLNWQVQNTIFHDEKSHTSRSEPELIHGESEKNQAVNQKETIESNKVIQYGFKEHSTHFKNRKYHSRFVNSPLEQELSQIKYHNTIETGHNKKVNTDSSKLINQNNHKPNPLKSQCNDRKKTKAKKTAQISDKITEKITEKHPISNPKIIVKYIPVNSLIIIIGFGCLLVLILIQVAIVQNLYQIKLYLKEVIK